MKSIFKLLGVSLAVTVLIGCGDKQAAPEQSAISVASDKRVMAEPKVANVTTDSLLAAAETPEEEASPRAAAAARDAA